MALLLLSLSQHISHTSPTTLSPISLSWSIFKVKIYKMRKSRIENEERFILFNFSTILYWNQSLLLWFDLHPSLWFHAQLHFPSSASVLLWNFLVPAILHSGTRCPWTFPPIPVTWPSTLTKTPVPSFPMMHPFMLWIPDVFFMAVDILYVILNLPASLSVLSIS